MDKYKNIGS